MKVDRAIVAATLAAAGASPDEEVCGLLFGAGDAVLAASPVRNVAADRRRTFEVDPAALLAAHRAARHGGPRLVGHYHSHPGGRPIPSPVDRAAAEPGSLWLILGGGEARLWRAGRDGFTEVAIELV